MGLLAVLRSLLAAPAPAAWEYRRVLLAYHAEPDWAALGAAGWELAAVYDSALPPAPTGRPFEGRAFVFKRPGDASDAGTTS